MITAARNLELQGTFITIEVHVDNSGVVRRYRFGILNICKMEPFEFRSIVTGIIEGFIFASVFIQIDDKRIIVIAVITVKHIVGVLAYRRAFNFIGLVVIVIIAAGKTLLPDDDAVIRFCVSGPLAVNRLVMIQRSIEIEQHCIVADLTVARVCIRDIPSVEGIAGAGGIIRYRGRLAGVVVFIIGCEHGAGEGRVAQVGVEDYPVTGIDGRFQRNVRRKRNRVTVLIDNRLPLNLRNKLLPTAELAGRAGYRVIRLLRYIRQIQNVLMLRIIADSVQDLIVLDRDACLVKEGNDVGVEHHGVVVDRGFRCSFSNAALNIQTVCDV